MTVDGFEIFLVFLISLCRDVIVGEVLDSGKLYIPIRSSFHLKCQNKVPGRFDSLVWRSSAYSKGKHDVYTYYKEQKREIVLDNFKGRLKRYDQTSIHIHNAQPEDSGNWECNILYFYKDDDEKLRKRVSVLAVYDVVVVSPPTISRVFPELVAVIAGYEVSSFCDAHGLSPFNITWKKESGELSKYVKLTKDDGNERMGTYYSKRTYIKFKKLSNKDIGGYKCIAENIAGKVVRHITVKLQVRPKIEESKGAFVAHEGQNGVLECNATGFPKVHFEWKFMTNLEYVTLRPGQAMAKFRLSKTIYSSSKETTLAVSKLHIKNVKREDWGIYKCNVENEIGFDRKDIKLSGNSRPSPPKIIVQKKIYPDQADLNWELRDDGGSPINSITVQYKSNLDNQWKTIEISKPLLHHTLTNLKPNSIYDFRVLSTNNVGNGEYSEVYQVKTSRRKAKIIQQNQTIGELGIISFIGVCGAALVALTCAIGCICLYFQEKRINRYQVTRQDSRGAGYQSAVDNSYN